VKLRIIVGFDFGALRNSLVGRDQQLDGKGFADHRTPPFPSIAARTAGRSNRTVPAILSESMTPRFAHKWTHGTVTSYISAITAALTKRRAGGVGGAVFIERGKVWPRSIPVPKVMIKAIKNLHNNHIINQ
jgi:hypothetical protein